MRRRTEQAILACKACGHMWVIRRPTEDVVKCPECGALVEVLRQAREVRS